MIEAHEAFGILAQTSSIEDVSLTSDFNYYDHDEEEDSFEESPDGIIPP